MSDRSPTRVVATVIAATDLGWRALTDDGTPIDLPRDAATRLRRVQPGQRVTVDLVDDVVVSVSIW